MIFTIGQGLYVMPLMILWRITIILFIHTWVCEFCGLVTIIPLYVLSCLGSALWLIGMLINIHSDHVLRNLRKPGETGYKIPRGMYWKWGIYSNIDCLENSMDRAAWWATVQRAAKSRARLKRLGTHSKIAWRAAALLWFCQSSQLKHTARHRRLPVCRCYQQERWLIIVLLKW